MAGMLYDNKAAAQLEQAYATTDMIVQREELRRSLRASAGESILDLGSGPGFLACELAREVGATGRIVAVDVSSDMNSIASKRIAAAGLSDRVDIVEGDATALAFADAVFDAAVSTQVIEYLAEPDAALHQLVRVLRPGGRLVIIDTDWDSLVWAAHGSPPRSSDRCRVERAPARPLPSALAQTPPPRGRIRGQRNPDRPDTQHGVRRHDLQLQHRPAHRRIRTRARRRLRRRGNRMAQRPRRTSAPRAVLL
ncbi:MAG TPA: methyltransferase domain-containing protein [Gaiellaceae bacterium]